MKFPTTYHPEISFPLLTTTEYHPEISFPPLTTVEELILVELRCLRILHPRLFFDAFDVPLVVVETAVWGGKH
jgi:hypothetical protein